MQNQQIDRVRRNLEDETGIKVAGDDQRRWWILAACCLVAFAQTADPQLLMLVFDAPAEAFRTEWAWLRIITNIGVVLFVAFQLIGGVLGDLLGRRRIFLLGAGGFLLGNLLTALATNAPMLLVTRTITGVMGALVFPLTVGIIRLIFTGPARPRAFLIYTAATGLGTLASLLALLINDWVGLRATLIIPTVIGSIGTWLAWRYLPESRARGGFGRTEAIVAASWTLVFLALIFAVGVSRALGSLFNPITLSALLISGLGTWVMLVWSQRSLYRGLRGRSNRVSRQFLSLMLLISATLSFALSGYILQLYGFFATVQQNSAMVSGIMLSPILLVPILALRQVDRFARDKSGYIVVATGLLCMAAAIFLTALARPGLPYLFLIPVMGLFGVGFFLASTSWNNIYLSVLPPDLVGASSGISKAAGLVGGGLAGVILTTAAQLTGLLDFQRRLEALGVTSEQQEQALAILNDVLWSGGLIDEEAPEAIIQLGLLEFYREAFAVGIASALFTTAAACLVTGLIAWTWLSRWARNIKGRALEAEDLAELV
ncbi:MFS transporter [Candidatus Chloroploca sp. M-50]|uniref:MFS transporter n=1 Tax=Candidatus Chloroploca mongolica TaxID=2528176 RepID=A0ABS4D4B0_9CHLR|nr:MFS transporter [Candidatus Chloroploca mongolica]MBP1464257.1 MFS transporter [Candidatus Chloroploca mongolica]